jgi:hypothetical protein
MSTWDERMTPRPRAARMPTGGAAISVILGAHPTSVVESLISANGGPMSTKNDYSAEEWKAIAGAPVAAGLFIALSDASGPVGMAKEALAAWKAISDSAQGEAPEIVKAVAEAVKSGERPDVADVPTGDSPQTKVALIRTINTAVEAVERKSPSEAGAYKTLLASVAAKVAQASKEGGFLGIGGTPVSRDEQVGLEQLADVLGVKRETGRSDVDEIARNG